MINLKIRETVSVLIFLFVVDVDLLFTWRTLSSHHRHPVLLRVWNRIAEGCKHFHAEQNRKRPRSKYSFQYWCIIVAPGGNPVAPTTTPTPPTLPPPTAEVLVGRQVQLEALEQLMLLMLNLQWISRPSFGEGLYSASASSGWILTGNNILFKIEPLWTSWKVFFQTFFLLNTKLNNNKKEPGSVLHLIYFKL